MSQKSMVTGALPTSWAKKNEGLNWVSKQQNDLDFVFTQDSESRSVIKWHLNSRSLFNKEPWVFKFWFYFWFVFHYFLKLLMFQRQCGKWESPERVSGFEFWNSTIQKFIFMFTKQCHGVTLANEVCCIRAGSLGPVRVCQSSISPLPYFRFALSFSHYINML